MDDAPPARPEVAPTPPASSFDGAAAQRGRFRHLLVVATALGAVALLKGLRLPNLWSATHATFNYSQGFIRRGLVGEVLRRVAGPSAYHYATLAQLAFAMFALVMGLLARVTVRTLRIAPRDAGLWGVVFVFLSSPGLVFWIHIVGYLDYVGVAIELFIVSTVFDSPAPTRARALLPAVLAASILLAFIHESSVVLFAPVFVFMIVCDAASRRARPAGRPGRWGGPIRTWAAVVTVLAVAGTSSWGVGIAGTRSPEFVAGLRRQIEAFADFPLRLDAFDVLLQSLAANVETVMPRFWQQPGVLRSYLRGLAVTLPGLLYMLMYGVSLLRGSGAPARMRGWLIASFLGGSLAPLLMVLVGWDFQRWNALATLSTFVCVCLAKRVVSEPLRGLGRNGDGSSARLAFCAIAVVLSLCASYPNFLFDGYAVHGFPFDERWDELLQLLRPGARFVPRF